MLNEILRSVPHKLSGQITNVRPYTKAFKKNFFRGSVWGGATEPVLIISKPHTPKWTMACFPTPIFSIKLTESKTRTNKSTQQLTFKNVSLGFSLYCRLSTLKNKWAQTLVSDVQWCRFSSSSSGQKTNYKIHRI